MYDYPDKVKSEDAPRIKPTTDAVQARFIDMLAYFPRPKFDEAVRAILHSTDDDYLAQACVRYLVGRGADEDIRRYVEKRLPSADKARREELERMRERLGWTPLHVAAEQGELERLEALIRKGADINAQAENGQTPLHVAADHGSYGAIRLLLDHEADLEIRDNKGRTPIQLGIDYDPAVEMFLEANANLSDILVAAFAGNTDVVKTFLDMDRTLVGATASGGDTPLHFAARFGHVKVAEVLIAYGADVNAKNGSQLTPLHRAASYRQAEVVRLLLKYGADLAAKTWDGRTALSIARENGDEKMIRLLRKGD